MATWILLAVDGGIYVLYVLVKEATRIRSKTGIKFSPTNAFSHKF